MRRVAGGVVLLVAVFVQAPGVLSADTKLDLLVDPGRFLGRAWNLWEPMGAFGQLQNQAYGYLFPMGPFFLAGHVAGLPTWVTQRLWWALVLLVAYGGVLVLADRLGIGTAGSRILAGLAFALSPRAVTELGGISVELWPSALAPWVMVPLVGVRRGSERRAAARSALVVACAGGVNAVAVVATLPTALVWLVVTRRARLLGWWLGLVPAAMAWWLGPLVLLGRYSPPFLDWIESSTTTTSVGSLAAALRGTTHWVAWLRGQLSVWPAGTELASSQTLALLGWVGVLICLAALFMRSTPHRGFLVACVVLGVSLLTAGHVAALTPPWAGPVRDLLDGPAAALRNLHKFDVVVRLPLALGLAHAVAAIRVPHPADFPWSRFMGGRHAVWVMAVSAVVGTSVPVLSGQVPSRGAFTEIPRYWAQAAAWLAEHDDGGRTLVVPGSPFATSVWGDPRDEPLQALATTPWAVRNVVPLSSAGNIRFLTAVEQQLSTGRPAPGLAESLARSGVSRLLVRADLAGVPASTPRPATIRAVLSGSPGFRLVASFGPLVGARSPTGVIAKSGVDQVVSTLQVWQVRPATVRAELWDASAAVRVAGGPENLLTLADKGLIGGRPVVLDGDPQAGALADAPLVVTDGPQRREATFSAVREVYSAPLTATTPWVGGRRVHDWSVFDQPEVVAQYRGVADVWASSEAGAASSAWAAADGDPATAWWVEPLDRSPPWWQARFDAEVTLPGVIGIVPAAGSELMSIEVVTERGAVSTSLSRADGTSVNPVTVPSGSTRWVRIRVVREQPSLVPQRVGLAEVGIPGLAPQRLLRLPPPSGTPNLVVLRTARDGSDGCLFVDGRALCDPVLARLGEEDDGLDRIVDLPAGSYRVSASARAQATPALDPLLRPPGGALVATASSRRSDEPAGRPQSLVDRDPGTSWAASPSDRRPWFALAWAGSRSVKALQILQGPGSVVSRAVRVRVSSASGSREAAVDGSGWVRFAPLSGSWLKVTVEQSAPQPGTFLERGIRPATFGASEIVVPALDDLRRGTAASTPVRTACGSGPPITIGATRLQTRVEATYQDLVQRRDARVVPCGSATATLGAGRTRVAAPSTALWRTDSLQLLNTGPALPVPAQPTSATVRSWGAETRLLTVPARSGRQVLVVHENLNAGWQATLDGTRLRPVRIDGWQQGWIVPAGPAATLQLTYLPNRLYQISLIAGLLLLIALATCAWWRRADPGRPGPAGGNGQPHADGNGQPHEDALSRKDALSGGVWAAVAACAVVAGGWLAVYWLLAALLLRRYGQWRAVAALGYAGGLVGGVLAAVDTQPPGATLHDGMVTAALWCSLACAVVLARTDRDRVSGPNHAGGAEPVARRGTRTGLPRGSRPRGRPRAAAGTGY
jgi:arabinofuranan 3-O-arabinosyltransferase